MLSNLSEKIDVSTKKVVKVAPKSGELYTLICYSIDPKVSVTKDLNLTVVDDVHIDAFTSDKNRTMESIPITLSWKVQNAQMVMLYPDGIDVTTTYRLEATNGLNVTSEILTISVTPIPRLNYNMPEFPSFSNGSLYGLGMKEMLTNIHEIAIDEWLNSPLTTTNNSIIKRIKRFLTSIIS